MNALTMRRKGLPRLVGRFAAALLLTATVVGVAHPAMADGGWEHGGPHWRAPERHGEHERWERHRYYSDPYIGGVYLYGPPPPPPVVYEPAPPPVLQFVFPLGNH